MGMKVTSIRWSYIAQAFENMGNELYDECLNMQENCDLDEGYEQLYTNYVQLLETIKAQRKVMDNKFDALDRERENGTK